MLKRINGNMVDYKTLFELELFVFKKFPPEISKLHKIIPKDPHTPNRI